MSALRRPVPVFLAALLFLLPPGTRSEETARQAEPTLRGLYDAAVALLDDEGYGALEDAIEGFELIVAADPSFLDAYFGAADAYLLKFEFAEKKDPRWLGRALEYANAVIEGDPSLAEGWFKRASIYFSLDRVEEARADLVKALDLDPSYLEARGMYLTILLALDGKDEAQRFARDSLEHFPGDPAPLKYFADIFAREGESGEAAGYYRQVIAAVPQAPFSHFALGRILQGEEKYDAAIGEYSLALEQAPDFLDTHVALSYCYGQTGNLEKAIAHLETYLKARPRDASALNNAALLYEQNGQSRKAQLAWLKVKESTEDKVYRERAERHLYRLLTSAGRTGGEKAGSAAAEKETTSREERK